MTACHTYSEEVLRLSTSRPSHTPSSALSPDNENFLVAELGLPSWVSKTDLGGTLEALGNLYARKRKVECVVALSHFLVLNLHLVQD